MLTEITQIRRLINDVRTNILYLEKLDLGENVVVAKSAISDIDYILLYLDDLEKEIRTCEK